MGCSCVKNWLDKKELWSDRELWGIAPTYQRSVGILQLSITITTHPSIRYWSDSWISTGQRAVQLLPEEPTTQLTMHTAEPYTASNGNVNINYLLIIVYALLLIGLALAFARILPAKSDAVSRVKCFWAPFRMNIHYPLVVF